MLTDVRIAAKSIEEVVGYLAPHPGDRLLRPDPLQLFAGAEPRHAIDESSPQLADLLPREG